MDLFGRQSSRDFLLQKSESLKASISGGSSRFMTSASDVKNGLFGGITSMQTKIDQLSNKIGGSLDIDDKLVRSGGSEAGGIDQQDAAMQRPKQRPKKPPLPKRISEGSLNGSVKQFNAPEAPAPATGRDKRDEASLKKRIRAPSGEAINFDEPLYYDVQDGKNQVPNRGQDKPVSSSSAGYNRMTDSSNRASDKAYTAQSRTGIQNPFMNDNYDPSQEYNAGITTSAEVHETSTTVVQDYSKNDRPDLMQRRQTNPFIDIDDPNDLLPSQPPQSQVPPTVVTSVTGGGPSAGGGNLGSDLLPGIPRVPSQPRADFLDPQSGNDHDLFAITPTSGEALPMPTINPSPVEAEPVHEKFRDPDEIYDDSDGDSEATEGCDEVVDDIDYPIEGGSEVAMGDGGGLTVSGGDMLKSGSMSSDMSWCSNDSNMDEVSRECMQFMKEYVAKIFDNRYVF